MYEFQCVLTDIDVIRTTLVETVSNKTAYILIHVCSQFSISLKSLPEVPAFYQLTEGKGRSNCTQPHAKTKMYKTLIGH